MTTSSIAEDMAVRPELLGLHVLLNPFPQFDSSQRLTMEVSHTSQAMVVSGAETPDIGTGWMDQIGKYEMTTETHGPGNVIAVIPKYVQMIDAAYSIKSNPSWTVIYHDDETDTVSYFEIKDYADLGGTFGYRMKKIDRVVPEVGSYIAKNDKFRTSPNHTADGYALGVNANVVYMAHPSTAEDAFVISDRLAAKLSHTAINTVSVSIESTDIPINLYGDMNSYKVMPDIGDKVRADGRLLGTRTVRQSKGGKNDNDTDQVLITDVSAAALRTPSDIYDRIIQAPPGAEIIDVEIFVNQKRWNEISSKELYAQLVHYQNQRTRYYEEVINVYNSIRNRGYRLSPEFNNLVTNCKGWCMTRDGRNMTLMNKKEPVDFINLKITYAYTRDVNNGFKISDLHGAKGVVAKIVPLQQMPCDEYGNYADLIIVTESPCNRLNCGQLYEQYFNHVKGVVARQAGDIAATGDLEGAFNHILKFCDITWPKFGQIVRQNVQTREALEEFIHDTVKGNMKIVIPPTCKSISSDLILKLAKEFGIRRAPLQITNFDEMSGQMITTTTKFDGLIGSKYVLLIGKLPLAQMLGCSFAFVSQFLTPIKPGSKIAKSESIIGKTPVRFGEDEVRILVMSIGARETARLLGLYGNSPKAVERLMDQLLNAEKPTCIGSIDMTDEQIIKYSVVVNQFHHMMLVCGLDLTFDDGNDESIPNLPQEDPASL